MGDAIEIVICLSKSLRLEAIFEIFTRGKTVIEVISVCGVGSADRVLHVVVPRRPEVAVSIDERVQRARLLRIPNKPKLL